MILMFIAGLNTAFAIMNASIKSYALAAGGFIIAGLSVAMAYAV